MSGSVRKRSRWFSAALAMACLSGFTLEGCSRSNRGGLTGSISDKAGQEALRAERHSEERRRLESTSARSKDGTSVAKKSTAPLKKEPLDSEQAVASVKKTSSSRESGAQTDLDNADWAGDYLDKRVKAVSDSRVDESEHVEPLLDADDENHSPEVAVDVWALTEAEEAEGTVRIRKPAEPESTEVATEVSRPALKTENEEHPWARKSPTRQARPVVAKTTDRAASPETPSSAKASWEKPTEPAVAADERSEAKARVQTLLTQGQSLMNKGELRQAYAVAQLAQRVVESEELFFEAGEEQPSDLIRSVQMQLRLASSDTQLASSQTPHPKVAKTSSKSITPVSGSRSRPSRTDIPDDWKFAEWQNDSSSDGIEKGPEGASSVRNTAASIRITPKVPTAASTAKSHRQRVSKFPSQRSEWAGDPVALAPPGEFPGNKPVTQTDYEELVHPVMATSDDRPSPSSDQASHSSSDSSELAQADWRSQSLDDIGVRRPLLVAPPQPMDELALDLPLVNEEVAAVDLESPAEVPSKSRLWIAISAAAGAVLLLLTRRRPVVPRSTGPTSHSNP